MGQFRIDVFLNNISALNTKFCLHGAIDRYNANLGGQAILDGGHKITVLILACLLHWSSICTQKVKFRGVIFFLWLTKLLWFKGRIPAGNYMFKVYSRNTRTSYEICPELTIKTLDRRHLRRFGILLLTLNIFHTLF